MKLLVVGVMGVGLAVLVGLVVVTGLTAWKAFAWFLVLGLTIEAIDSFRREWREGALRGLGFYLAFSACFAGLAVCCWMVGAYAMVLYTGLRSVLLGALAWKVR